MAARAELRTTAKLDNKQFKQGVDEMRKGVRRFASQDLKNMAKALATAFVTREVVNFGREFLAAADAIDNAAKQIGIGVEELQTLQRITELTVGSTEKLDATLRKLAKSQANAVAGETEQVRGFKQLGITLDEVQRLNPAQLFERIAQSVNTAGARSEQASGASIILGRNYVQLNEVIRQVAEDGLANLNKQMLETNQIMSKDAVAAADAMEEEFNRAFRSMTNTLREWSVEATNALKASVGLFGALAGGAASGGGGLAGIGERLARAISPQTFAQVEKLSKATRKAFTPSIGGQDSGAGSTGGEDIAAATKARIAGPSPADQIARIGGIIGRQTEQQQADRTLKQSLTVQEQTKVAADKIAAAAEEIKKNTAPIREG